MPTSSLRSALLALGLGGAPACALPHGETGAQVDTSSLSGEDKDNDGHTVLVDCDDREATIYPGAPELCDGIDQDCDGLPDNRAVDATLWHADVDGDGWGNPAATRRACSAPPGHVAQDGDCDDLKSERAPDQRELCNGVDDDCDGEVDEDC